MWGTDPRGDDHGITAPVRRTSGGGAPAYERCRCHSTDAGAPRGRSDRGGRQPGGSQRGHGARRAAQTGSERPRPGENAGRRADDLAGGAGHAFHLSRGGLRHHDGAPFPPPAGGGRSRASGGHVIHPQPAGVAGRRAHRPARHHGAVHHQ